MAQANESPPNGLTPEATANDLHEIKTRLTRIETRMVTLIYALGHGDLLEVSKPNHDRQ